MRTQKYCQQGSRGGAPVTLSWVSSKVIWTLLPGRISRLWRRRKVDTMGSVGGRPGSEGSW